MKTYLVETYSQEVEFEKDSLIVALTPAVCYQLDKKGIRYSISEDYNDAVKLSRQAEEHRKFVFQWINDFDDFLMHSIEGMDAKLATIYRWYLKGMIIDPLYACCYELNHIFETIKPTEVFYITNKPAEPQLNFYFEHYGRSLYSEVIPIICHEKNIPLTTVFTTAVKKAKIFYPLRRKVSLLTALKNTLYKSGVIKRLYFIFRCLKNLPDLNKAVKNRKNIFLPLIAYIGEDFVADSIMRGHNVYLLSGDTIFKYTYLGTRRYQELNAIPRPLNNNKWGNAAELLTGHNLIKQISRKCQLDISEIVVPRLRYFITKVCPDLDGYMKSFIEFYKKASINLFFTPYMALFPDYAALAGAKRSPQITTAWLAHGDGVYDSRVLNITELENADIHISSNIETTEYFRHLAQEIHSSAKLFSNPHRFRNVIKIAHAREKLGARIIRKNRVVYVPTFMYGDYRRIEGITTDTWYYQFQKSLVEYFASRREFHFVWKGPPQGELIYSPIPDFIKDNHYSNVEFAINPLVEYLLTADRIICDLPSTGFYEAVIASVPTMSLYHASCIVRKGAVAYFGNLLKLYYDAPEAIRYIKEFLDSDPEQYKMKIDMAEGSLFDILERTGK